jgi:hypothetical protein
MPKLDQSTLLDRLVGETMRDFESLANELASNRLSGVPSGTRGSVINSALVKLLAKRLRLRLSLTDFADVPLERASQLPTIDRVEARRSPLEAAAAEADVSEQRERMFAETLGDTGPAPVRRKGWLNGTGSLLPPLKPMK